MLFLTEGLNLTELPGLTVLLFPTAFPARSGPALALRKTGRKRNRRGKTAKMLPKLHPETKRNKYIRAVENTRRGFPQPQGG
jgi:hypothetical protein